MQQYLWWGIGVFTGICLIWYFFFSGVSVKRFANYPPQNETIVAFGDSLVQGVGATQDNDLFSQVSAKIGMRIINKGVSGNTTADGLARVDEVIALKPGVVIVVLGGNDYLRQVPKEDTFANLRAIVRRLQEVGAVVVVVGVRGGLLSDHFEPLYEELAADLKTGYVPNILKGLLTRQEYMADSIHPNDKGYAIIAEKIAPLLLEIYE
ncbi:MAG: hypothetical protein RI911_649 [Candidatus Parcubacteria bacterium]|jgi:lysophospholipase L1-like esterase